MKRTIISLCFIGSLILLWQAAVSSKFIPPYLLPSPLDVAWYLFEASADGTLPKAALVTMQRLVVGFLIAVLIGLPLGCLCARFQTLADTVGIMALSAQALPSVCWVPFALLAFGQSEGAMLFVVIMGSIGSILLAADNSIRNIPSTLLDVARTMGSRGLHTVICVLIPAALPQLFSGMRQGWAFAWRSLMAAEIYVTILSGLGLGQLLHYGRELHAMEQVIGVMLVVLGIGLLLDRLVMAPIESQLRLRRGVSAA